MALEPPFITSDGIGIVLNPMPLASVDWRSFDAFEAYVRALAEEKDRGDAFETFVSAYLSLTSELSLTDVWPLAEAPDEVMQRLGLTAHDIGVDFIGRRRDGSLWAIQAKFRSDRAPVPWRELSTFIGSATRAQFRLLVSNSVDLPRNRPVHLDDEGFGAVLASDLQDLDGVFFERWAQLLADRRPIQPPRKMPRPDQVEAIAAISERFAAGDTRLQLIAACGTGKTLTALWVVERLDIRRVLVFCPSLALVHQTLKAWTEQADPAGQIDALVVCSDVTVGDTHPSELPIPVTKDHRMIRQFWTQDSRRRVLLSTYQSIDAVHAALRRLEPADLLIADEAHRLAGREGKPFQGVLRDDVIPASRRLCMTATPRILVRRKGRDEDNDERIASMDDPRVFGTEAYRLTFGRAIQLGLLADYQIDVLAITDEEVRDHVARRVLVDATQRRLDAETLAQAVALDRAIRQDHLVRYAFTFHHRVRSAQTFTEALQLLEADAEAPQPYLGVVEGAMSIAKRRAVLRALLMASTGVVCSAKALSEGVDAPAVDAVVFVDPKSSVVDIVQAVGRALRRDPKNPAKRAHIVVPVVIGNPDNPEADLEQSAWSAVWQVVQAMRAHDEVLAAAIDAQLLELGRRRVRGESEEGMDATLGGRLVVTLPARLALDRFRSSVSLHAVDVAGDSFWRGLGVLQAFVEREGHARVAAKHIEQDLNLGSWVNSRRQEYRRKSLSAERIKALEAVPGWTWYPYDEDYEAGFAALSAFVAREGHARVPRSYVESRFNLGQWATGRRVEHRRGTLSAERKAALEKFRGWSWDLIGDRFEKGLDALRTFVAREGHAEVPARFVEGGFLLEKWIGARRSAYRRGKLDREQIAALETVPHWTWDPLESLFQDGLQALRAFANREGHARVPSEHVEGGFPLGSWAATRRAEYRQKRLTPKRKALLESFPGWTWDLAAYQFQEGLRALRAFIDREGHTRVPKDHVEDGVRLGGWVSRRRTEYGRKKLGRNHIKILANIPEWTWNAREERFQRALQALRAFAAREGHARVPKDHVEEAYRLGNWVDTQRQAFRRKQLDRKHVKLLDVVPGWWWGQSAMRTPQKPKPTKSRA